MHTRLQLMEIESARRRKDDLVVVLGRQTPFPPLFPPPPPPAPGPLRPTSQSFGFDFFQQGNASTLSGAQGLCQLVPGDVGKALCFAAAQLIFKNGGSGDRPDSAFSPRQQECPEGRIKFGETCIDPSAFMPGGTPFTTGVGEFTATTGAFGMAGFVPQQETRTQLKCPRGFVLGTDDICYAKAQVPKRSKFRKWKGEIAPPVTRRQVRAIRTAASAREAVLELAKDVGLHVSKSKPAAKKNSKGDHELIEKLILATRS